MGDPANAALKIARADHHLSGLKLATQQFFDTNHYLLRLTPNPHPPKYVLTASRHWVTPADWSVIVGDCAHNARSSLDMIIYQLSDLAAEDRARRNLQFPIFDDPAKFAAKESSYLNGVDASQRTIIEAFQPYHSDATPNDPLRLLAEINNADKHRLIHVVEVVTWSEGLGLCGPGKYGANLFAGGGAAIRLGSGASVDAGGFFFRVLRDVEISNVDAPIAEIESAVPPKLRVQPKFLAEIRFGAGCMDVEGRPVIATLTSILDRVKEVARRLGTSA